MKLKLIILIAFLSTLSVVAQQAINYKALIKDNLGNVLANQAVTVQFTILEGAAAATVYQEDHTVNTDANGIAIVNIGAGNILNGDYNTIDWGADDHFLNVQIDSGAGLVDLGTTQFLAVPYALYAETSGSEGSGTAPTGLEALDEGNGIGWRLVGRNPSYYGNIGKDAVDLSYNYSASDVYGATGNYSTALGYRATASGSVSTAMGQLTQASGSYSIAMGYNTIANQVYAIAMGRETLASGNNATSMGYLSAAQGSNSTAMGYFTFASGSNSTAMGYNTTASGGSSFAAGHQSQATGSRSIAMGNTSVANQSNAVAIGEFTTSSGISSVAMGAETTASGNSSFAVGDSNVASGGGSVAMGIITQAIGDYSFAMGNNVQVSSFSSSALGYNLINDDTRSMVVGQYNDNTTTASSLFMVGNGVSTSNRSNALEVLQNGKILAPSLDLTEINEPKVLVTKEYLEGNYIGITSPEAPSGLEAIDEGNGTGHRLVGADPANYGNIGQFAVDLSTADLASTTYGATGSYSTTMGRRTKASAYASTAMGLGTVAQEQCEFVVGKFNTLNGLGLNVLFHVGNGSGEDELSRSSAFAIYGNGNGWLEGTLAQSSDRRLKQDIKSIDYGLSEVLKLKPVSYHWKKYPDKRKSLGLIAQDIQPIISEIVHTAEDKDHTLSVSYIELIPVLIKAIQEQQAIIDQQALTIENQETASAEQTEVLQALLKRVEALEKDKSLTTIELVKN